MKFQANHWLALGQVCDLWTRAGIPDARLLIHCHQMLIYKHIFIYVYAVQTSSV